MGLAFAGRKCSNQFMEENTLWPSPMLQIYNKSQILSLFLPTTPPEALQCYMIWEWSLCYSINREFKSRQINVAKYKVEGSLPPNHSSEIIETSRRWKMAKLNFVLALLILLVAFFSAETQACEKLLAPSGCWYNNWQKRDEVCKKSSCPRKYRYSTAQGSGRCYCCECRIQHIGG